jgi:hypothetical protein
MVSERYAPMRQRLADWMRSQLLANTCGYWLWPSRPPRLAHALPHGHCRMGTSLVKHVGKVAS